MSLEVRLKSKRDIPVRAGHPWVFSNALERDIQAEPGALVSVLSAQGDYLGRGIYNPLTSIRVRIITRDPAVEIDQAFFKGRIQALTRMKTKYLPAETTAYRVVHGDADGLPGLIVDRYEDVFVFQIHTAGMDRFRPWIIEALKEAFEPGAVIERSDLNIRKREGLKSGTTQVHTGEVKGPVPFSEQGLKFSADVLSGQKTGFYLDQREARQAVRFLARGKSVLNLFSYTGAFSVYAAAGEAQSVTSVDASLEALQLAQSHFQLNGLNPEEERFLFVEGDVFEFCQDQKRQQKKYDLVICDPPAFAKTLDKRRTALEAYMRINTLALALTAPGGMLVTSSCSGVVTHEDFRSAVRIAAGKSGKNPRVIKTLGQPFDHTDLLAFPEGRYLKTLILETA